MNLSADCEFVRQVSLEAAELLLYSDLQKVINKFILPLVLLIGLINNTAFIYVVLRFQSMRTLTNSCLVHLGVADLLYLVSCIGERLLGFMYSPITPDDSLFGAIGCCVFSVLKSTAYFSSLSFITLVSLERFYAVCRIQKRRNPGVFKFTLYSTWITTFVLSTTFIPAFSKNVAGCYEWPDEPPFNELSPHWTICVAEEGWIRVYADLVQTIPYFILLAVNLCLYCFIILGLNEAVKRAEKTGKRVRNTKLRNQIAWMLIVTGILFFTFLSPKEIMLLIKTFSREVISSQLWETFSEIGGCLSYINSCINPIIYSVMSSRYRKAFQEAFLFNRCTLNQGTKDTNTNGNAYTKATGLSPEGLSVEMSRTPRLNHKEIDNAEDNISVY